MNKKITALGCATLGITITGSAVLAALMLDKDDNDNYIPDTKPLDRGDNYEHYNLNINFDRESLKDKFVDYEIKDNHQTLVLSEKKFKSNIENIVRETFKSIDRFKTNADKFKLDIHYQFNNQNIILVDVV
jgi:patatin-like phospholipase/acyl hydrolase